MLMVNAFGNKRLDNIRHIVFPPFPLPFPAKLSYSL